MATYKVLHSIQDVDELSKDRYVNVFHFGNSGNPTTTDLEALGDIVRDFYNVAHPTTPICQYYSSQVGAQTATIKTYLVDTALTHVPLTTQTYTFNAETSGVDNFPAEVALVLSLKSNVPSVVSPKRRRGRLYFGPLNTSTGSGTSGQDPSRPNAAFRNVLLTSASYLRTAALAAGFSWVVHSPTQADALDVSQSFVITDVSVDDAWDTQRRRGIGPTVRDKLTLV